MSAFHEMLGSQPTAALVVVGDGRQARTRQVPRREAMRALKRQLSNVIYQHLLDDVRRDVLDAAA